MKARHFFWSLAILGARVSWQSNSDLFWSQEGCEWGWAGSGERRRCSLGLGSFWARAGSGGE